jgi:cysteine synthase
LRRSSSYRVTPEGGEWRPQGSPEVDFAYQVPDDEALQIIFDLAQNEGLLLGGSSG